MKTLSLYILAVFLSGCAVAQPTLVERISQVQRKYAPDKRVAIFQVEDSNGKLTGKTNLPEAHNELIALLNNNGIKFIDEIRLLPDTALGNKTKGIVRVSVGNMRSVGKHSGELATQALLGTVLNVWEEDGEWYRVQTPDGYIAWIDHGAILRTTEKEAERWLSSEKIIFIDAFGFAFAEPSSDSQRVGDLTAGNLLQVLGEKNGFFQIVFPDGRNGYVPQNQAINYKKWLSELKPSEENLVSTAKQFMGLPYLWGGTSFKGVDCSGFTKSVYALNGIMLPRDASQQVNSGILVDEKRNWEALRPGDLLFFGKKNDDGSERVVHVGIWIGNGQFIHASSLVQVNSINPTANNYDAFNTKRYLRSKRILK